MIYQICPKRTGRSQTLALDGLALWPTFFLVVFVLQFSLGEVWVLDGLGWFWAPQQPNPSLFLLFCAYVFCFLSLLVCCCWGWVGCCYCWGLQQNISKDPPSFFFVSSLSFFRFSYLFILLPCFLYSNAKRLFLTNWTCWKQREDRRKRRDRRKGNEGKTKSRRKGELTKETEE